MAGEQPRRRNLGEQGTNPDQSSNTGMFLDQGKEGIEPTGKLLSSIYEDMSLIAKSLREIQHIHELMLGLLRRLGIMYESMPQLEPIMNEFIKIYENMSSHLKESGDIYKRMYDSMSKLVKENKENDQNDQNDQ